MKLTNKVKGLSKKKKLMIAAFVILAAGGVTGSVVYASQTQQKLNEAQAVIDKEYTALQGLEKEIQALFDEKDSNFLAEGVTAEQIDALKTKITAADKNYSSIDVDLKKLDTAAFSKEKTTAEEQLELASEKLAIQEAVNGLFSAKDKIAIKGSTVSKDLAIADKTDEKAVNLVKESLDESSNSTFDQAVSNLVVAAEGQLKQISTAKTATEKVYKEKVISTDQKLYDAAKKEVEKIKNATAKKTLSDQLAKVKKDIDKKSEDAKKAEEKKAQEESGQEVQNDATAEAASQEQQATTDEQQAATGQNSASAEQAAATGNDYNEYNYGSGSQATGGADTGTGAGSGAGQTPAQPSNPTPETGGGGATQPPITIIQPNPGNCGRWFDSEAECVAAKGSALLADDNAVSASHWWDLQSDGSVKWTYSLNY